MVKEPLKRKMEKFMECVDSRYGIMFGEEYSMIGDNELYGGKHAGSDAELAGAERIAEEMRELGLENIEKIPVQCTKYQFNDAAVTVVDADDGIVIRPFGLTSPGTDEEGITAEIVDAGTSKRAFYDENDVKGKIVMVEAMGVLEGASPSAQIMQAELRGAAAVLQFATEDLLTDETIRVQAMTHIPNIPIVGISIKDAEYLRKNIKQGKTLVNIKVDAEYVVDEGTSYSVVGEIPGETDERIIFSGHLDHYFRCMQDNIASVCTLLGIAKAMKAAGYKPQRTMTFVFNSSHEAGMSDSRYPYISGSYRVLAEGKPEWIRKTIADINFEYSALATEYFTAFGSYELNKTFDEFLEYVPAVVDGFSRGVIPARRDCYTFLSWADTISYISNGIPTFMNDSLHEQVFELTSPYIGRDHSNSDNMEVFDEKALKACTQYFGAFGIFIDNMPLAPYEFTERIEAFAFNEDEEKVLKDFKVDTEKYREVYSEYLDAAKGISSAVHEYNCNNGAEDGVCEEINEKLHDINKFTIDAFDKISPQDALVTAHEKYIMNMQLLAGAKVAVESGDVVTALQEFLSGVDVAAWSRHFDKEIVDFARDRINGKEWAHRRLWASGRELSCLTMWEAIFGLEKKLAANETDFSEEIKLIEEAFESEKALLTECLEKDMASMKKLAEDMAEVTEMI